MRRELRRIESGGGAAAFDHRVDALRIERARRRSAPICRCAETPGRRRSSKRRARRAERRPAGRRRARSRRRRPTTFSCAAAGSPRPEAVRPSAPQDRPATGSRSSRSSTLSRAISERRRPPEPKARSSKRAVAQIDRPAPPASREQLIENVAGDRRCAFARWRPVGGANGETQRVANGRIAERSFERRASDAGWTTARGAGAPSPAHAGRWSSGDPRRARPPPPPRACRDRDFSRALPRPTDDGR